MYLVYILYFLNVLRKLMFRHYNGDYISTNSNTRYGNSVPNVIVLRSE